MNFKQYKNPTTHQIGLLIATGTALLAVCWLFILQFFGRGNADVVTWAGLGLIVFLGTYFISRYFLEEYIYRKIKIVYKRIRDNKLRPEEKKVRRRPGISIESVEEEVRQWADRQEKEIEQLRAGQEYRRKFLGDISHELKTPVFNIQGYIETLLDGAHADPQLLLEYLRRASNNVDRLITIIEDLEVISRLESGELPLEIRPFDVKALVEEVFEDFEITARQRQISLQFKQAASRSFEVRADREYIRQVFANLISNSIKYGKEGGSTRVGFYDMDNAVLVEIADDGIGIAREHLPHIFDRFYRVDKSRSRTQGGSGLGLSIVKHILEAHGQAINVRSTPGVGTTFAFTLEKA